MWTFVQHTAGHGGERRGRGRGGRILPRGINRRGYWRGKGKTGIQGQRWGCGGALTAAELMLADCWSPLLLKLPLHKSKGAKQSFGTRHPSCSNPVLAAPLLVVDDETGSTWVLRWRRVSHSLSTPCPHSLPALPARLHAHILTKNQKREPSSHARRPVHLARGLQALKHAAVGRCGRHLTSHSRLSPLLVLASRGGGHAYTREVEKYFGQKTECKERGVGQEPSYMEWCGGLAHKL